MKKTILKFGFWFIFIAYLVIYVRIVFLSRSSVGSGPRWVNLVPFQTIQEYINLNPGPYERMIDVNIWGNILLFVPMGIYASSLQPKVSIVKGLLIVFLVSLGTEIVQFTLAIGSADVDDLILNTIGGLIGIMGYFLLYQLMKNREALDTFISIVSLLIGLPVIVVSILLYVLND